MTMRLEFHDDERSRVCDLERDGERWTVILDGGDPVSAVDAGAGAVDLLIDGRRRRAWTARRDGERLVFLDGRVHVFRVAGSDDADDDEPHIAGGPRVVAEMPGKVVKVHVAAGDLVEAGAPLLILEAMKMEAEISAPVAGRVAEVLVEPGRTVGQGDLLLEIEPSGEGTE